MYIQSTNNIKILNTISLRFTFKPTLTSVMPVYCCKYVGTCIKNRIDKLLLLSYCKLTICTKNLNQVSHRSKKSFATSLRCSRFLQICDVGNKSVSYRWYKRNIKRSIIYYRIRS